VQERGSVHLVRLPIAGGKPEYLVKDLGSVSSWSLGKDGKQGSPANPHTCKGSDDILSWQ